MPYSLLDQLRLFSPHRFEELCGQLVGNEVAPEPWGHVEGSGGDEGIDIFSGILDSDERSRRGSKLRIWQVKHFFNGLKTQQRKKVERSLLRVLETHHPDCWTLCLPTQLTVDEQHWFSSLKRDIETQWPGIRIEPPWLGEEIVRRTVAAPGLVDAYFLRASSCLSEQRIADLVSRLDSFESVAQLLTRAKIPGNAMDFYNGTVPDWGNIIAGHDARREMIGEVWELIRERSRQEIGGRIPLALIRGGAMDGKSTILMRLAVELVHQDYQLAFFYKPGTPLDADQFLALDLPPDRIIVALIDGLASIDLEEIQNFFERLHRGNFKIMVVATALTSIWRNSTATLENVAEVHEFDLSHLTDADAESLLDKLGEDPAHAGDYLGTLAHLTRAAQLSVIREKAKRQLGVVLLEAKHNTRFEAFVIREFDRLATLHGALVRRAFIYISGFHRFDVAMPTSLLKSVLPNLHIEDDLLRVSRGFVKYAGTSSDYLTMRHSCWADVIFRHVAPDQRTERSWLCELLAQIQADGREDKAYRQMLKGISQRGAEDLAYDILKSQELRSAQLLGLLASIQRRRGDLTDASRVLRQALDIHPDEVRLWLALAQVEADLGNLGALHQEYSARWLFKRATEIPGDPHPVYTWHAWAVVEAQVGQIGFQDASQPYTARWLFKKATEVEPQVPHSWAAWAQLEAERGNLGDLTKRGKRRQRGYSAREIFWRATHEAGSHSTVWRQWAMLEVKKGNLGSSFNDPFTVRWLYWQLLRVDPNNSISWRAWAIVESEAGNIGFYREDRSSIILEDCFTARWMFWRGTTVNPRDAGTWQAWGMLELAQRNWGDPNEPARYTARWLFRRATEANPIMPHAWNGWAKLEQEDNRWRVAARLLERVGDVEVTPRLRAIGYFKAALAREKVKQRAEHERLLRKVLEVDPENMRAHVYLGRSLSFQKQWREAEQHFNQVFAQDSSNSLCWLWFTEMQAYREKEAGNWERAERLFLEAADLHEPAKKKSQVLFEAAIAAGRSRKRADMKRHLQAAIAADDRNTYALARLGRLLGQEGNLKQATHYLERAIKLDPSNKVARSWYNEIARRTKETAAVGEAAPGEPNLPSSEPEAITSVSPETS